MIAYTFRSPFYCDRGSHRVGINKQDIGALKISHELCQEIKHQRTVQQNKSRPSFLQSCTGYLSCGLYRTHKETVDPSMFETGVAEHRPLNKDLKDVDSMQPREALLKIIRQIIINKNTQKASENPGNGDQLTYVPRRWDQPLFSRRETSGIYQNHQDPMMNEVAEEKRYFINTMNLSRDIIDHVSEADNPLSLKRNSCQEWDIKSLIIFDPVRRKAIVDQLDAEFQ